MKTLTDLAEATILLIVAVLVVIAEVVNISLCWVLGKVVEMWGELKVNRVWK